MWVRTSFPLRLSFRRGRPTLRPVCLHPLADRAAGRSAHCPTSPARCPCTSLRVGVCKRGLKGRDLRIDPSLLSFELPDRLTDRSLDIDRHKSPPISDHGRFLISREVTASRRPSSICNNRSTRRSPPLLHDGGLDLLGSGSQRTLSRSVTYSTISLASRTASLAPCEIVRPSK